VNTGGTFWEAVRDLRKRGRIPRQWRVADIMSELKAQFSVNYIRTAPANQSISIDGKEKGNYVLKGAKPEAYRLGDGLYELIGDHSA
jgi:hypothetical protein